MENKNMKNIVKGMAAFCLLAFAFGCGIDDNLASPTYARVKFFHGVPDAPSAGVALAVDGVALNTRSTILVDTLKYLGAFPATSDSSYYSYSEGSHNIKISTFAGATAFTADVPLVAGKNYTVLAADTAAKIAAVIVEDVLPAPANGQVSVRVIHLSPNAPNVDVFVSGQSAFTGIAYKGATAFAPVRIDTGTVKGTINYEIRAAGTSTVALKGSLTGLLQGRVYTIVARGFLGKTPALGATTLIHGR
jgi:hypothetical protein